MLRRMKQEDFEKYVSLAYQLALDLSHASFPIYTDGIKTKEDFMLRSRRGLENGEEELLLFEYQGQVEGWIHYYYISEDRYIGVNSILAGAGYGEALKELLTYWEERFPGYQWDMYFPEENTEAIFYLSESGYQESVPEVVDVLLFDHYDPRAESGSVIEIGLDNFEIFREIHNRFEEDMYWTSDRILNAIGDWEIFAFMEGEKCKGVLYYNGKDREALEIFGIDIPGEDGKSKVVENLLVSCLNKAKDNGAKSMYFFSDKSTCVIAERLGFRRLTIAHYFTNSVR